MHHCAPMTSTLCSEGTTRRKKEFESTLLEVRVLDATIHSPSLCMAVSRSQGHFMRHQESTCAEPQNVDAVIRGREAIFLLRSGCLRAVARRTARRQREQDRARA